MTGPAPDVATLMELMRSFNETSARLQQSHDALQRRVAELTRELEEKNAELARKNRLAVLGEMAACLAHEIRNPLGGIQVWASLLERDFPAGTPARATLDKVMSGLRGLDTLVEEMLMFARDVRLDRRACDLAPIVAAGLDAASRELGPRAVARALAPAKVLADATMLARVFANLAINAAQATPESGRIEVVVRSEAGRARVSLRDDGPGIAPETLPKIFTPFFTNRSAGTGLGLAIARRIVEAHDGTIAAANDPGGGAVFTVELPLA